MTLTVEAPDRGFQQRKDALANANAIRTWRKEQKEFMSGSRAIQLIWNPCDNARTWPIGDLLKALPNIGPTKRDRLLLAAEVDYTTPLMHLTHTMQVSLTALIRYQS